VRPAVIILVLTTALLAAGCGGIPYLAADGGNPVTGKALFTKNCGACHTLADAGTTGTIGPNLDEAFRFARNQGFDDSTFRNVIRGQIAYSNVDPETGAPGMPANILQGQQADDVAIYVAKCAGVANCNVVAPAG
jgi:mono/diheme cytochrome c family protein